jgi:hypothetical protein
MLQNFFKQNKKPDLTARFYFQAERGVIEKKTLVFSTVKAFYSHLLHFAFAHPGTRRSWR